jgi:hypothetical protein
VPRVLRQTFRRRRDAAAIRQATTMACDRARWPSTNSPHCRSAEPPVPPPSCSPEADVEGCSVPALGSAQRRPPCPATIVRVIEASPIPAGLRRIERLEESLPIVGREATRISHGDLTPSLRRTDTHLRGRSTTPAVASIPLRTRFRRTCSSWTRSPRRKSRFRHIHGQRNATGARFALQERHDTPTRSRPDQVEYWTSPS